MLRPAARREKGRAMKKRLLGVAVAASVLVAGGVLYGLRAVSEIRVAPVAGDVSVLQGLGGNVGVLRTPAGPVVVDSMTFRMQGEEIREKAEEIGGGPVQVLLNTHWHSDHSHGNPGFAPGTKVVATSRTLHHLRTKDAGYWEGAAAVLLPNETFDDVHELVVGGKTIRALSVGRGHTDGDLVVLFVDDGVLHTGDLFFHRRYPNIDLESGGSIREWIATLDRVLALDFDRVIPGHGAVTDRAGILQFQTFLRQLWAVGERAARQGLSLEETLRTADLTADAGYQAIQIPFVVDLDRDFVIQRAFEEATGAVRPAGS